MSIIIRSIRLHGGYYNVYWYLLLAMLQSSCVVAGGHLWLSWYHLPSCKWWISDQQHMLTAHCPLQANLIPTQFTVLKGGSKIVQLSGNFMAKIILIPLNIIELSLYSWFFPPPEYVTKVNYCVSSRGCSSTLYRL